MAVSIPAVITRYFAAQAGRDFDTLVTLFADDAIVVDEGKTRRGTKEIRAWRENVASVYEYTTDLLGVEAAGEGSTLPAFAWKETFQVESSNCGTASPLLATLSAAWRSRREIACRRVGGSRKSRAGPWRVPVLIAVQSQAPAAFHSSHLLESLTAPDIHNVNVIRPWPVVSREPVGDKVRIQVPDRRTWR
jgi:hypothetical protein